MGLPSCVGALVKVCNWLVRLLFDLAVFAPKHRAIGQICSKANPKDLQRIFSGKHVLVVGGTKGIGSGIAVALAEAGAIVHLVGRDKAAAAQVLAKMEGAKPPADMQSATSGFQFHPADLGTVQGCVEFVNTLALSKSSLKFDAVVMTLGVWPDLQNPWNTDGYNKVMFLDVIARGIVFLQLHEKRMLADKAMIMSVLEAAREGPLPKITTPYLKNMTMKSGGKAGADILFLRTLFAAGSSGDAFLAMASRMHDKYKFISTFPGLIATDVMAPTFGAVVGGVLKFALKLLKPLQISMSEYECGVNHLNILAHVSENPMPISFWDHFLQARHPASLTNDEEFQGWVWTLAYDAMTSFTRSKR